MFNIEIKNQREMSIKFFTGSNFVKIPLCYDYRFLLNRKEVRFE